MKKRIIICADGTWNSPEKPNPTNVLKLSRAISPIAQDGLPQQVFYDWGIGSYHDSFISGVTGKGLHKNIKDCYRYLVQNYNNADEIFLFGFSRGAYTIRSLCGLINNCGILKRENAKLINTAFEYYKNPSKKYHPSATLSKEFKNNNSHKSKDITFVGVWDTVGAMGIPISFLGLFEDKDEFYDTKMGKNIKTARHALAIDEHRSDFVPTIWDESNHTDIQQVWFCGAHSDTGGSYKEDKDGSLLSDIPLKWLVDEAKEKGLGVERYLENKITNNPNAYIHNSRRSFYRIKEKYYRKLEQYQEEVLLHSSVKKRWESDNSYRPKNLAEYIDRYGWRNIV